mmetsp:Transcript_2349/g.3132  ORF Transcript_2349/g.3132 Transcript_2349/m.3132 type:complete len:142 (-) Transcript_2349:8-433(-)
MDRLKAAIQTFHVKHERVKKTVHTAWRVPLPKWGQYTMSVVYFSLPLLGGYALLQWINEKREGLIGAQGERLQIKGVEGTGNTAIINGNETRVGAGGFLGGVKFATSDAGDQQRNKEMLESFFRHERKKRQKKKQQNEDIE